MRTHYIIESFVFVVLSFIVVVIMVNPLSLGITINSDSMEPTYKSTGFHMYDQTHAYEDIEVGDVVVYECDESSVYMHRVHSQIDSDDDRKYTTKGDNNEFTDQISGCDYLNEESYEGKVVFGY